jgi:hypothetical protein
VTVSACAAKLEQRARAERRRHEQSVRSERAPDLNQCAGEIVDAMQREARDDQIETRLFEGKQILIANEHGPRAQGGEFEHALRVDRRADGRELRHASSQHAVIGAEIERERKRPQHERDALGDLARDMGKKEFMGRDLMREASAARPQQFAIEQEALVGHRP